MLGALVVWMLAAGCAATDWEAHYEGAHYTLATVIIYASFIGVVIGVCCCIAVALYLWKRFGKKKETSEEPIE